MTRPVDHAVTVPPTEWVQVLPETSSNELAHVLDETCWCRPTLVQRPDGFRFSYRVVHAAASSGRPVGPPEPLNKETNQ